MVEDSSRLANASRNIATGTINQVIQLLFSFTARSIFIKILGAEYLGIGGLFINILQVLSLADLGFSSAIVYTLYKPIAEGDEDKQAALMGYYKKIYAIVAVVVTISGLAVVPFLKYIINLEREIPHLTLYYLLYLANTVMSYLFIYKISITTAHQKSYLLNIYDAVFSMIQYSIQILLLVVFKNFTIYLVFQLCCTFSINLFKSYRSQLLYPYISKKIDLDKQTKKEISLNLQSMFIYKIGSVILFNTDSILISIFVGTLTVGYYSNYKLIIGSISVFTSIIFSSITAIMGSINASGDREKQFFMFKVLDFVGFWVFSFCSICFFILMNDFIFLWIGRGYLLNFTVVLAMILNFYLPGSIHSVAVFRDTTGIFKQTKYIFLTTALLNLILSLVFGKLFGLAGILYATVAARILTNLWFEPYILYKSYFKVSPRVYFLQKARYVLAFLAAALIVYLISSIFNAHTIGDFIIKMIICTVAANGLFLLLFRRKEEFLYITNTLAARSRLFKGN